MAMCMVFNYSVDFTDFRHKNSILLLLEKHRSYLSGFIVMPFPLKRCQW